MSSFPDSPEVHHHGQPGNTVTTADLPDEILCDIFKHVLQMSWRDLPSNKESLKHTRVLADVHPEDIPPDESMLAPLHLSQVCRLWRDIAWSCPSLWTDIAVFIYGAGSEKRDEWLLNAVDTRISRSNTSPLRLRIECDASCADWYYGDQDDELEDDVPGPRLETTTQILRKLLDHQSRWRDASFTLIADVPGMLPQLDLVDTPLLESLSICWGEFTERHDMTQIYLDISCSPRLRSLQLVGILRIITGRVSNLRELTLDSWYALRGRDIDIHQSVLLEIFRDMPNLEVLNISILNCISDNPQGALITLPKLHTLVVDTDDCTFIVSRLVLPELKRLTYKHFPDDGCMYVFSDMLVRSRASVEYFAVCCTAIVEDVFGTFLRLIPSLKTLRMEDFLLTPDLLEMLFVKHTGESLEASSFLCPNLEELSMVNCTYLGRSRPDRWERNLRDMLRKRCHALGRAATINFHSASPSDQKPVCIPSDIELDIRFRKPLPTEG